MRTNWKEFGIESNRVIEVANNKTAIVFSHRCQETFVMAVEDNHVYYECYSTIDLATIRSNCIKECFSTDFIITSTDDEGEVFLKPASSITSMAVVVDEVLGDKWHLEQHRTKVHNHRARIGQRIIDV